MTVEAARTAAACISSVYFLPVGLLQFVVLWSAEHSSVANADCPAAMGSLLLRGEKKKREERKGGLLIREGRKGATSKGTEGTRARTETRASAAFWLESQCPLAA